MSSEDEYEEQEVLVYLDFNSKLDDELFTLENEFKLIGLESEAPVLQLGNQVFQGEWKDSIGTRVFFETDENHQPSELLFDEQEITQLKYLTKTDKILRMSRIFVNSKKDGQAPPGQEVQE